MVYLKGVFAVVATLVIALAFSLPAVEAGTTKIAYKKSIHGKSNIIKEKRIKAKPEKDGTTTVATIVADTATTMETTTASITATTETLTTGNIFSENVDLPTTTNAGNLEQNLTTGTECDETTTTATDEQQLETSVSDEIQDNVADTTTNAVIESLDSASAITMTNNRPVACTCGVFLSSQFKRGSAEQPSGKPVIMNELDRSFICNPIGQKQCQTKCLEMMVQHLPNSANILCATLNRDCRKERAYLFIKNCTHSWWNTNLTAGREYCCKNGQSYPCPLV